jgi:hypothetical protein
MRTKPMKNLKLNKAQLKTLEHCFRYGEVAVSTVEVRNGEGARRVRHIKQMRAQLQEQDSK